LTPTKLLIGQILIVFAIVLGCIWFATQWAAAELAYQPELGAPWLVLGRLPVYHPWALFIWWYHYDAYAPHIFDRAGAIAGASGFIGCGSAIAGSVWRARQQRHLTTYGSARWASRRDARRAGLLDDAGIFLGTFERSYLRHDGPEHVMAFAPTRSGKGVGLVVPTLLGWTGSTVVHDIKGENWQLTAGCPCRGAWRRADRLGRASAACRRAGRRAVRRRAATGRAWSVLLDPKACRADLRPRRLCARRDHGTGRSRLSRPGGRRAAEHPGRRRDQLGQDDPL
jgi:hypothetical protein